MTKQISISVSLLVTTVLLSSCATTTNQNRVVRVAVIGGMMRTGLWPELAKQFESETGYHAEVAMSGNRDLLAEAIRAGKVDLVTMHASETASNLVSEGYACHMRVWTRNEFVIAGPSSDPASVRGQRDGAAALTCISKTQSPFVDYQNSGPREISVTLWNKAGIRPQGDWVLSSESGGSEEALAFARTKQAYVVLGRVPKIPTGLEILVQGDSEMQRPFVVIEANQKRFPQANLKGARALADYLLTTKAQNFLLSFGTNMPTGMPLFYPVKAH